MSLLDSFFFLFKTNAKEAQKDVEAFGKSTQNVQDKLNSADKSATSLGLSFSKLALAGVGALEGFAALGKLKDGITNAVNYNAQIEKTAKLTNINARELAIWNGVVAQAGGNPNSKSYLNFITALNDKYAALGLNDRIKFVNRDLLTLSKRFKDLEAANPGSSQPLAAKLGIDHDLWLALTGDIKGAIAAEKAFNNTTEETARLGLKTKTEWALVGDQFQSAFTDAQPLLKALANTILFIATVTRDIVDSFGGLFRLLQAGVQLIGGNTHGAGKSFDKFLADAQETVTNNANLGAYYSGSPGGGSGAATSGGPSGGSGPLGIRSNNPGNIQPGGREAVFGTLAEGIAAEKAQIGRYGARGVNTLAGIAARWPDRAHASSWLAAVAKVSGFGPNEKLDLNDPATVARIARGINAAEGDGAANGILAGQGAIAAANSAKVPTSSISNQKSVTIGSITIHSQATDAGGIASDLHSELSSTVGAFDDGVKY